MSNGSIICEFTHQNAPKNIYQMVDIHQLNPERLVKDQSCNHKRPQKTGLLWTLWTSSVFGSFWNWEDQLRLQSKPLGGKRLDWTGLSNTTKYGNSLSISCFLALVPSKSIRTKNLNIKYMLQLVLKCKIYIVHIFQNL